MDLPVFENLRSILRKDNTFGVLFLLVLSVPLAFTIYTRENFETVKYALWLSLLGVALLTLVFSKGGGIKEAASGKFFRSWPAVILLGFFLFVTLSFGFSPDKINGFFGFYYRFTNSLLFYLIWVGTIFFLILKGSRQNLLILVKVLIFDALVISVLGVFQTQGIGYYEGLDMAGIARAPSLLGNPIFSSMFIACVFPFVLYFSFQAEKFSGKLYYGLAGFFMAICVIALASRGAWVGLLVGFLTMLAIVALYAKNKKIVLFGFLGIILAIVLGLGFYKAYNVQNGRLTLSLSEENAKTRLYAWGMAQEAVLAHPFVGVGLGNFQDFFEQNKEKYLSNAVQNFDDPHNLFLQLAATAGIPATVCFVVLLSVALYLTVGYFKKQQDYLALAVVGALIIFSVSAAFTPVAIPCFLFLAVLLALVYSFQTSGELTEFSIIKPVRLVYSFIGIGLVLMGASLAISEHIFYKAVYAYAQQNYKIAEKLSSQAIYINPTNQLYYLYKAGSQILGEADPQKIAKSKQSLIRIHPKAALTYSMSGTLNFLSFIKTGDRQYFQAASDAMRESLKIDPYSAGRYVRWGYFNLVVSDLDTARELTKSGLSLDKQNLPGWFQLAKIYQVQGKKTQLIYALDNALKIRPDIMELRALAKRAKEAQDPTLVPVNLPPERGQLE